MQSVPHLSEEATGLRQREKGWASVQKGKERKKEARGRRGESWAEREGERS